jgi:hypothetical protein
MGHQEDVSEFLARITSGIHNVSIDGLQAERAILRAEAQTRGDGGTWEEMVLAWRYGFLPYGRSTSQEYALESAALEHVTAWAEYFFTTENAVLCLTGPPPKDLSLTLAEGARRPPPPSRDLLSSTTSWFASDGVMGALALLPHSAASEALSDVLAERLFQVLRLELNAAYSPQAAMEVVGDTWRLWLKTDVAAGREVDIRDTLLAALPALARDGPTDAELASWRKEALHPVDTDALLRGRAFHAADQALLGNDTDPDELLSSLAEVTAQHVAMAAQAAYETALFALTPGGGALPIGMPALHERSDRLPHAESCHPWLAGQAATLNWNDEAAVPDAESWSGTCATVRFEDAAGLLCWPHGARVLLGYDGFGISIEPADYEHPERLLAAMERGVPAHLRIGMPALREPPQPPTRAERRRHQRLVRHQRRAEQYRRRRAEEELTGGNGRMWLVVALVILVVERVLSRLLG